MADLKDMVCLIFDFGSGFSKVGFSRDVTPRSVFPSVIGRSKNNPNDNDTFVGHEAVTKKNILTFDYPIRNGIFDSDLSLEKILHYSFLSELNVCAEESPIYVMECPLTPRKKREMMVKVLFEKFNVPGVFTGSTAVCSLYSTGRVTGVSIDLGHSLSSTVPIFEGYIIPHAVNRSKIAGDHITSVLKKFLGDKHDHNVINELKEKHGYVRNENYSEKHKRFRYDLPDGSKVNAGEELYRAPEVLFRPKRGIHKLMYDSIQKCDADLRKELYHNIVLSGGTSKFEGIVERLSNEVKKLVPKNQELKIFTPVGRDLAQFRGGSLITSTLLMGRDLIDKFEYDDCGESIVHRKCFSCGSYEHTVIWSMETQNEFEDSFQYAILFLLWCNNQENASIYVIPPEVMYIIFSFLNETGFLLFSEDFE